MMKTCVLARCFVSVAVGPLLTSCAFTAGALGAAPASAAPITWVFDAPVIVMCAQAGGTCPASLQPVPCRCTSRRLRRAVLRVAPRLMRTPIRQSAATRRARTLDLPALGTTWTSLFGSIEVGSVEAPRLGVFPCFGCLAAFGYFSQNSNPAAPLPPGGPGQLLPFEFRAFGPQFLTDALPSSLALFQMVAGFFVARPQIVLGRLKRARSQLVVTTTAAPALAWLLARHARGERRRRGVAPPAISSAPSPLRLLLRRREAAMRACLPLVSLWTLCAARPFHWPPRRRRGTSTTRASNHRPSRAPEACSRRGLQSWARTPSR